MYQKMILPIFAVIFFWLYEGTADVGMFDYSGQCVSQTGVSQGEAETIQQGNLPQGQQGKCYVACVLKSLGVVNSQGKISVDNTAKLIDMYSTETGAAKDRTKTAVTSCAREANTAREECEVSYRMMRCVLRKQGSRPPQTRNLTIGLPQTITFQLPPLSLTLFSIG